MFNSVESDTRPRPTAKAAIGAAAATAKTAEGSDTTKPAGCSASMTAGKVGQHHQNCDGLL